jgi:hypothetical protein
LGLLTLASVACALVPGVSWVFEVFSVVQLRVYQPQAKPFEMFDGWPETFGRIQPYKLDDPDKHLHGLQAVIGVRIREEQKHEHYL